MRRHHRDLERQTLGRQDDTTSPSASAPLVDRHIHVHRIPRHVRDDRDTPLVPARNGRSEHQFPIIRKKNIFAQRTGRQRAKL
jgi:hypothetical protein